MMTSGRDVFIDCGAYIGEVLRGRILQNPCAEYYAFEANPSLMHYLEEIRAAFPRVHLELFNQAVWIEDGEADFFLSGRNQSGEAACDGSTLLRGKIPIHPDSGAVDYEHPIRVKTIDFSRWLLGSFTCADHLTVKMDIEGAEYCVLEKMIAMDSLRLISQLIVEFHYEEAGRVKLSSIERERHDRVVREAGRLTKLTTWH